MCRFGGALGRVPAGAGALRRIPTDYALFALGSPMEAAMAPAVEARLARVREALAPVFSDRVYLNFAERPIDTAAAFGIDTLTALAQVKAELDP